jgi:hypothetical protein
LTGSDSYPLPTMTLPSLPMETTADRLRRFEQLCAKHGVVTRNTRIDRYRRYLKRFPPEGWELTREFLSIHPTAQASMVSIYYPKSDKDRIAGVSDQESALP